MSPSFHIRQCVNIIRQEGVITYPTESVYGLGCDPLSEFAVLKILTLKQRPASKGLILIAAQLEHLKDFVELTDSDKTLIYQTTSPTTWLVNKSRYTPRWVSGDHNKLAIRLCQHPIAQQLCNALGHPLISTSANPAGARPAQNLLQARQYFSNSLDYYLGGDTGGLDKPTPIIDLKTRQAIRL